MGRQAAWKVWGRLGKSWPIVSEMPLLVLMRERFIRTACIVLLRSVYAAPSSAAEMRPFLARHTSTSAKAANHALYALCMLPLGLPGSSGGVPNFPSPPPCIAGHGFDKTATATVTTSITCLSGRAPSASQSAAARCPSPSRHRCRRAQGRRTACRNRSSL